MTPDIEKLIAFARAHDREEAAQRGEPSPWPMDGEPPTLEDTRFAEERIACVRAGFSAIRSKGGGVTVTPAERFAAWLADGPRLAGEAGCYVAIKVTEAKRGSATNATK